MLSGRVLDSRSRGGGFGPHRRHCVVSLSKTLYPLYTVDSEIFMRVLFSRIFAYAKLREIKFSQNGEIILSFTDMGKSCHSGDSFMSQICLLTLFPK